MTNPLLTELIARHAPLATLLAFAKEKEMKLRLKIVALAFAESKKIGTNNLDLPDLGFSLKAVCKESIKLDEAGIRDLVDCIPNNEGLLKETYSMSISKYRDLSDEHKALLVDNVTIKEDSPSLSYDGVPPAENLLKGVSTNAGCLMMGGQVMTLEAQQALTTALGFTYPAQLIRLLEEV